MKRSRSASRTKKSENFSLIAKRIAQKLVHEDTTVVPEVIVREARLSKKYADDFHLISSRAVESATRVVTRDPYESLMDESTSPEFIDRICGNIRQFIEEKRLRYRAKKVQIEDQLEQLKRQMDQLTEDQQKDDPSRHMLIVNIQLLGRISELVTISDAYCAIFFDDPKTVNREIRDQVQNVRNMYKGKSMKDVWHEFIKSRLRSIMRGPNGFTLLQSEAHRPVRTAVARLIKTLASNYKVFRTKYNNMVFMGPPGVGKTTVAKAVGTIMGQLLILFENDVKVFTAADFVAEFEGQTPAKVKSLLTNGLERVIFLDEAYALLKCPPGGGPKKDDAAGYGIEAVNEMVAFMSDYTGMYVLIVAGYERPMRECFLTSNEGFARRFDSSLRFNISEFSTRDLLRVFDTMSADVPFIEDEVALIQGFIVKLKESKLLPNSAADIQALVDQLTTSIGQDSSGVFDKDPKSANDKLIRLVYIQNGLDEYTRPRGHATTIRTEPLEFQLV